MLAGREFSGRDREGTPAVVVINESFARRFSMADPVGRIVAIGKESYRIVGLVGDAKFISLRDDNRPMIYLPYLQNAHPPLQMTFQVRTAGNLLNYADPVRQAVRRLDPRLAIFGLMTQAAHIDQAINREILLARLCTTFAVLALLICCVGLYGTVTYGAARRTREIGIRVALGAQRKGVIWLVLREVVVFALAGLAIGIPGVLAGTHIVKSLIYGIEPNDPLSITASVTVMVIACLIAAYLPARRASKIDPIVAIRNE